ncbi:MAG: CAP domain-containing protein, partial [Specibacter sp.]
MRKTLGLATALAISAALLGVAGVPAQAVPVAPPAPATSTPAATSTASSSATASASAKPTSTPAAIPATPTATAPAPASKPTATPSAPAPTIGPKAAPAKAQAATALAADPFLAQILAVANRYRADNNAGPVVLNAAISTGSQQWAATVNGRINNKTFDMAKIHRTDYGVSILPKGSDMSSEIIGINNNAQQIVDWWMGSPGHRAALLDPRATDIGIGYVKTTSADWSGMTVVVANLAGYADSRKDQPKPTPQPVAASGDVAAVDSAGNLYIYGSAKGGDLWKRTYVSSGWSGVQQLELVDYNADGVQDVIAVWKNGNLTVSFGQAGGTFKAQQIIGKGWGSFDIVVSRWKTADKFPSIIAKYRVTGDLFLYPNTNGINFAASSRIGTGWGPLTIIGADFDGDKKQDLLARNAAGQLLLYRGNGNGGFISETRRVIGVGWGSLTHVSGIANHLGTGGEGILARSAAGNLLHYPIMANRFGAPTQIGTGGW